MVSLIKAVVKLKTLIRCTNIIALCDLVMCIAPFFYLSFDKGEIIDESNWSREKLNEKEKTFLLFYWNSFVFSNLTIILVAAKKKNIIKQQRSSLKHKNMYDKTVTKSLQIRNKTMMKHQCDMSFLSLFE